MQRAGVVVAAICEPCHDVCVSEPQRAAYRHGNLPAAVLDETIADLADADPVAINFHRIAKRLGVSHSAIYRHYPSKQDLIDALAQRGFERLGECLADALVGMDDASRQERIIAMGIGYVHCAVDNPILMRVTFSSSVDRNRETGVAPVARRALGFLHHEVVAAAAEGLLGDKNPPDVTRYLWAGVHGEALLRIETRFEGLPGGDPDPEAATARTCRLLVASVFDQ